LAYAYGLLLEAFEFAFELLVLTPDGDDVNPVEKSL
jgi:hypothetical protein